VRISLPRLVGRARPGSEARVRAGDQVAVEVLQRTSGTVITHVPLLAATN
jgi:hypothetical protein